MSADPAPAPGAPPAAPKKPWKGREPDEKDRAVMTVLHAARVLVAPQLQLLYGLASPGSLQPRLVGNGGIG